MPCCNETCRNHGRSGCLEKRHPDNHTTKAEELNREKTEKRSTSAQVHYLLCSKNNPVRKISHERIRIVDAGNIGGGTYSAFQQSLFCFQKGFVTVGKVTCGKQRNMFRIFFFQPVKSLLQRGLCPLPPLRHGLKRKHGFVQRNFLHRS